MQWFGPVVWGNLQLRWLYSPIISSIWRLQLIINCVNLLPILFVQSSISKWVLGSMWMIISSGDLCIPSSIQGVACPSCSNLANLEYSPGTAAIWQQLSPVGSFSSDGESCIPSIILYLLCLGCFLIWWATVSIKISLINSSTLNKDTNVNT